MLRDDRARGSKCSVLTASHTGALLYPRMGYERIGTLFMFAPSRAKRLVDAASVRHSNGSSCACAFFVRLERTSL